jgi:aldehyde dehydrogenase
LDRQRAAFLSAGPPSLAQRRADLKKLKAAVLSRRSAIETALSTDFGHRSRHETAIAEILALVQGIDYLHGRLRRFMRPTRRHVALPFRFGRARIEYQPLGVIGIMAPWNYPLGLALMPLATAIAAGNRAMIKPSEFTPAASDLLTTTLADTFPLDQVAVVTGSAAVGAAFSALPFDHLVVTGSTGVGREVMKAASANLVPVTLELGGKSPNIFFADVCDKDDAFFDKALEGFAMFALNQGEVCTCPSRALIQESIYERFMERALKRVADIKQGDPLSPNTMIGAQASSEQLQKILSYLDIARQEGAQVLAGGAQAKLAGDLGSGFYVQPTVLKGNNKMRVFQEEIFGPVVSVATFKDQDEALSIANDTLYGLGAGVWSRDINTCYRMGRAIQAGRVWTNCYHAYPAHAAFGGYKQSGVGRENHKMMLDHYQQTKNLLVSYSPKALGFF